MSTLFPDIPQWPEGFRYLPDFISGEEEDELLLHIADAGLHTFRFQGYEAKRKVASFGYDWNFETRTLSAGNPIPAAFLPLMAKIAGRLSVEATDFGELLLTEYPAGSVINWHRDAPPFELIAGISLRSDCIFRLRPHEREKGIRTAVISIPVSRRSLYIIEGEARSAWQHSIATLKEPRYSITLRTLRKK